MFRGHLTRWGADTPSASFLYYNPGRRPAHIRQPCQIIYKAWDIPPPPPLPLSGTRRSLNVELGRVHFYTCTSLECLLVCLLSISIPV